MVEEVLFETEQRMERAAIADYLRTVADNLTKGEAISLRAGDDEVSLTPPDRPTFEVKAEREGPSDGHGELSVEFELEWPEDGGSDDEPLEIS